ncbi:hypothetical protein [Schleiferilactobacillus harbinensis]|uniref:Uncharacterized protein n=1 Tax=Schleiferilactobacillus harbinensis TaxID=304207 RepID=A0ABU7T1U3_9LACO
MELQWVFQTLHHLGEDEYAQALSHRQPDTFITILGGLTNGHNDFWV